MTSILKVTEIQDPTNSNTALTIDSSGRVLSPKLVRFHAHLNAYTTTTSTGANKWSASGVFGSNVDQIVYNVGSGYDSSTTTFTAPVTGMYHFILNVATNGAGAAQTYMGIEVEINGVRYPSGWEKADSSGYHKQHASFPIYCEANDTVEPRIEIASNTTFVGGTSSNNRFYTYFAGYLVG